MKGGEHGLPDFRVSLDPFPDSAIFLLERFVTDRLVKEQAGDKPGSIDPVLRDSLVHLSLPNTIANPLVLTTRSVLLFQPESLICCKKMR